MTLGMRADDGNARLWISSFDPPPDPVPSTLLPLPAPPRLRVVIVDDHERMRWAVRELLESAGCRVVGEAADGPSGVAVTLAQVPDVLVVDWRLPGFDGLAVAARVRLRLPGVRVVLFTAEPVRGDRVLFGGGAVDAVVAKGSLPQELIRAVTGRSAP